MVLDSELKIETSPPDDDEMGLDELLERPTQRRTEQQRGTERMTAAEWAMLYFSRMSMQTPNVLASQAAGIVLLWREVAHPYVLERLRDDLLRNPELVAEIQTRANMVHNKVSEHRVKKGQPELMVSPRYTYLEVERVLRNVFNLAVAMEGAGLDSQQLLEIKNEWSQQFEQEKQGKTQEEFQKLGEAYFQKAKDYIAGIKEQRNLASSRIPDDY